MVGPRRVERDHDDVQLIPADAGREGAQVNLAGQLAAGRREKPDGAGDGANREQGGDGDGHAPAAARARCRGEDRRRFCPRHPARLAGIGHDASTER